MVSYSDPNSRSRTPSGQDRSGVREKTTKLPFVEPVFHSAVAESGLPRDVVAEWSGGAGLVTRTQGARTATGEDHEPIHRAVEPTHALGPVLEITAIPTRPSHVQEYPIDDEALLFDPKAQTIYQLNETAYAVWRGCDGRTIRDLALDITARFEVEFETSSRHITELVGLFAVGGLLTLEATDAIQV